MATQPELNLSDRFTNTNGKQETPKKHRKAPRVPSGRAEVEAMKIIARRHKAGTLLNGTRQQIADEIAAELNAGTEEAAKVPRGLAASSLDKMLANMGLADQYRRQRPTRKAGTPRLDDCETTIANLSVVICDLCRVMVAGSMVGSLPASIVNFANLELEFANLELDK